MLLNKHLGLSHGKIAALLHDWFGLHVRPRRPSTIAECQRLAAHLTTELPALFGFLFDFTLDATDWRAKQALRPAVVNRKVSGGNRSVRGAETQQILSSVIQTARVRDLQPRDVLVELLRAPQPTVSSALATLQ